MLFSFSKSPLIVIAFHDAENAERHRDMGAPINVETERSKPPAINSHKVIKKFLFGL